MHLCQSLLCHRVSNSKQKGTKPTPDPLHVWQNPYAIGMQNIQMSKQKFKYIEREILYFKHRPNSDGTNGLAVNRSIERG